MKDLYKHKYRISSCRLQSWNYGNPGMYFVTICTKNREYYFGEIVAGEMELSELGEIAKKEWMKTLELRPDMNLELGEFVVMPNHIHGIIIIGDRRDAMHGVSTITNTKEQQNHFSPQSKNLASIIRGYKSSVTTYARKNNLTFDWQPRFHDHIIRSMDNYNRISSYINNNPAKWLEDKFHIQ